MSKNNTLCPLLNASICNGSKCVLWRNPEDNNLDRVIYNCYYRLSLKHSIPKNALDPFNFDEFKEKKK